MASPSPWRSSTPLARRAFPIFSSNGNSCKTLFGFFHSVKYHWAEMCIFYQLCQKLLVFMLVLYIPVTAGTHFFRTSVTPSLRITSTVSMQHQISHYIYHAIKHNTKQYRRPTEAIFCFRTSFKVYLMATTETPPSSFLFTRLLTGGLLLKINNVLSLFIRVNRDCKL